LFSATAQALLATSSATSPQRSPATLEPECRGCDIPAVICPFTYFVCLDHHIPDPQLVIRMIDRKEIPAIGFALGCAWGVYVAGEHLQFSKAPAQKMLTIMATSSSTTSASIVAFNTTTFAKVDPPPPVVPPGDRQQQG
jgi:hypothetical protein